MLHFVVCGGVFNATHGSISSPNYPGAYPNHAKCRYKIIVPFGYTLSLNLTQLDIEMDRSCDYDSLQVFDGESEKAYSLGEILLAYFNNE